MKISLFGSEELTSRGFLMRLALSDGDGRGPLDELRTVHQQERGTLNVFERQQLQPRGESVHRELPPRLKPTQRPHQRRDAFSLVEAADAQARVVGAGSALSRCSR